MSSRNRLKKVIGHTPLSREEANSKILESIFLDNFGPEKAKCGNICKTDDKLLADLISIHNAENWLWVDRDIQLSIFDRGNGGDEKSDIATKILPLNGSLISNK